jgi:D-alanyl-D-alanine carboxypeptidase/D-alanyl-D-alanine-endopeptidase (penicillin-binding protein 4)
MRSFESARRRAVREARTFSVACAFALLCAFSLHAAHAAHAQDSAPTQPALIEHINELVTKANLGPRVSLSVIDLGSAQTLVAHNATVPLNPASNLKLLTAATAMIELGPEFRTRTAMFGREAARVEGGVCIKGQADPSLTRADLTSFAQRLLEDGVHEVDAVVIDGSYFDAAVLPPAFDQQPNEVAPFRAAVAALSVNANAYSLRVKPGAKLGAPVIAAVDGSGYFELDNGLTTSAASAPNVTAAERDLGDRIALSLQGSLPLASGPVLYMRRVTSPLAYAGYVFIDALHAAGIKTPERVTLGSCAADAPLIVMRNSPALAESLTRMGKDSDNFVAEMVLKTLGAERRRKPGTSEAGVSVVMDTLQRLHVPLEGVTMINGSGLFQGNRVTTALISQLLLAMYRNPSLRDDFIAHLAVGGIDGTLARRFRNLPAPRIVRAKTGTLDDAIALSGYVLGPTPERAFGFSFLANGVTGKHGQARDLIDRVVDALVARLYTRPLPKI